MLAEGVQILPVELGLQLGAQGFLPVHQLAAVDAMHLPVDPDGVRQAGVQVDHIDGVVLLPQGADDLLAPDIALLPLQALPEHIVHVLGAQQGQLLPVGVPEVAHRLQQLPAEAAADPAAEGAVENALSGAQALPQVVQPDEGPDALHVLRVQPPLSDEPLQPVGQGLRPAASPVLPAQPDDLIGVLCQVRPDQLLVDVARCLHMGGQGDDKGGNVLLPENPGGHDVHRLSEGAVIAQQEQLAGQSRWQTIPSLAEGVILRTRSFRYRIR